MALSSEYASVGANCKLELHAGFVYIFHINSTGSWIRIRILQSAVPDVSYFGEVISMSDVYIIISGLDDIGKSQVFKYLANVTSTKFVILYSISNTKSLQVHGNMLESLTDFSIPYINVI